MFKSCLFFYRQGFFSTFQVPAAQAFFDLKGFAGKLYRLNNGWWEGKPEKLSGAKSRNFGVEKGGVEFVGSFDNKYNKQKSDTNDLVRILEG